jgi:O-antigen ligase
VPPSTQSKERLADIAASAAAVFTGLTLPASIVVGRAAVGVGLGLILLSLLASLALGRRWIALPPGGRPALLAIALVGVSWLPATLLSLDLTMSVVSGFRTLALAACTVLLVGFLRSDPARGTVALKVFVGGMVLAGVFTTLALEVDPRLVAFRAKAGAEPWLQLKASASVMACALPVMLFAGHQLGRRWLMAAALAVALGLVLMVETHSRSSMAGVLIAILLAALLAPTRRLPHAVPLAAAGTILAALAGWLAWLLSQPPLASYGPYDIRLPLWIIDRHRQVIWQFTTERFLEHPWFGWGLNVADRIPGGQDLIPGMGYEFIPAHPHSWAVQLMTEGGVIGFAPLLAIVLGVAVMAAADWRRRGGGRTLTWLTLWSAFWVASLFNFSFWAAWWTASNALLAALTLSAPEKRKNP